MLALALQGIALKRVPRTGWLDRGVPPDATESVADHSYNTALLAWACALARQADGVALDSNRVLQLALLHDLAEATTGDAPPYDASSLPADGDAEARRAFLDRRHIRAEEARARKQAAEDAAMVQLLATLPDAVRERFADLWDELRNGASAEARFVKQIDRLETFLQSRAYLQADPDLPVASFQREVAETIDDPLLAAIRDVALESSEPGTERGDGD
jgi:putative hydrolase of HD superfamily